MELYTLQSLEPFLLSVNNHGFRPLILHSSFVLLDEGSLDLIQFDFLCGFEFLMWVCWILFNSIFDVGLSF